MERIWSLLMLHILSVCAPAVTVAMTATVPAAAEDDPRRLDPRASCESMAGSTTWLAEGVNPSKAELEDARGRTIPDVLGPDLDVVFVGINPGLWSGAVGHHFARPGNRFWKALYGSGFTDRLLSPFEDASLLDWNLGVTNLVARTTARADELSADEIRRGAFELEERLTPLRPRLVAVLGIGAYRTGFGRPLAALGPQEHDLAGSRLWVLPNPSGLNAHHQLDDLTERFRALRKVVAR
jgi:TDG/mug DNA glycosylase family protein